ncbi:MAG: hypothetical protein FWC85_03560 [Elusimicrobia bacterium]|nr:hypothetical protein [Elusimicrobiota bacterium]
MKKCIILFFAIVFLYGCGAPKKFAGYSTLHFQRETVGRFETVIDLPAHRIFRKNIDVVETNHARVLFTNRRRMFVVASHFRNVYQYSLDSTEIGMFITPLEDGTYKVEVISNNSRLARAFSELLFEELRIIEERDIARRQRQN